ncbi:hypothetical protein ACSV9I_05830 [Rhizobium sp. G187]|uniref:hypothetical protein n=1 Tax=Rhizobium sp. G187 TaxID=3451352 RepID=UPI003EE6A645
MTGKLVLVALLSVSSPVAVSAAERIYCAASDSMLDMSLESGFSKKDEQKLIHFRGVAGLKDKRAPAELRRFQMDSEMIRQYWTDDRDLRFSLQAVFPKREPVYRLTLSLLTTRKSADTLRFEGEYVMALTRLGATASAGAQAVLEYRAPIFCSIKR